MTTIAFAKKVLASDSRLTEKNFVWTDKCKKIWRLSDGSLFGSSGDNEAGLLLLDALKKNRKPNIPQDREMKAIHVRPDGKIYLFEGYIWDRWPEDYAAIGSGMKYALAALRIGADAVTAVKAGIAMDVHSGGRVQVVRLRPKKKQCTT